MQLGEHRKVLTKKPPGELLEKSTESFAAVRRMFCKKVQKTTAKIQKEKSQHET